MRAPCLIFLLNGKEIYSRAIEGSFCGGLKATIGRLAREYGCAEKDIIVKGVIR